MPKKRRPRSNGETEVFQLLLFAVLLVGAKYKHLLPISWGITLIPVGAIVIVSVLVLLLRPSRMTRHKLNRIDSMSGEEFEYALLFVLRKSGWKLKTTKKSHDRGADLLGTAPWGKTYVIQAKRWKDKVGTSAVQQAIGAKAYYGTDVALVITNNYLTRGARELAHRAGVETWERGRLQREIAKLDEHNTKSQSTTNHADPQ